MFDNIEELDVCPGRLLGTHFALRAEVFESA